METKAVSKKNRRWTLVAVALIGLAVLFGLDTTLKRRFEAEIRTSRDLACQQFKQNIEDFFSVRFGALLALKSFYESSDSISSSQFQTFCSGLLKQIPYYRAIAFADYNFFIREVYPRSSNPGLVGLSLKEPAEIYEPFRRAIKEQRLTITSAVNLRNIGIGLMANLPVFRNGRLYGVVIGIFDFNEIVEKSVSPDSRGQFHFRLLDPQGRIIYVGPGDFPSHFSQANVQIGDSIWKLYFAPKSEAMPGMKLARQMLWLLGLIILGSLVAFLNVLERKNSALEAINGQLKKANERIREFEAKKQELILQRMSDGVIVVDADLRITMANSSAVRMLEKPRRKNVIVGERIHAYLEPFESTLSVEKIFYAKDPVAFEISLKDADIVFAGMATALTDQEENRVGTVLTLRNVTAAKRLEKLKAEFIGQMSHKLLTPLAVIRDTLGILDEGLPGPLNEKQAVLVQKAGAKTTQLANLIQRLLDFTQIENRTFQMNLQKEACYVEDIIGQALKDLDEEFQAKDIALERALMSGLTLQGGDRNRLKQMLVQVLENAAKFNPPGTRVRLTTALANGKIMIEVSDNGVGIPHEELPMIFDPFFQVDTEFTGNVRGAGVGLSIARQIAKAHDGDITVGSEQGKGSTFRILLPYK